MSKWRTYKLGELVTIKGGKRLPKGVLLQSAPNHHPYIRIRDLGKTRILELDSTYEYVDDITQKSIARYVVEKGDILLSIVGTIGLIGIVGESLHLANQTENCVKLINLKTVDRLYLYYYLSSTIGQIEIQKGIVGAVQAKLPIKNIENIEISLPPLAEQKRIADILSAIDDKIELNRRINANLEQQAQALYKSWFVDNNTNKIRLEEVVKTTSGGTPSRSHTEYYGGNYGWIKSKELNGSFISKTEESITDLAILKSSAKILPEMSVLIAMYGATVGQYAITSKPMTCNQAICALLPNENYPYTYLFMVAKNKKEELINNAVGSAQQNISQVIIKDLLISNDIAKIKEFHNKVAPIFGIIRKNTEENINLSTLRDTLLPKLMSGEITV